MDRLLAPLTVSTADKNDLLPTLRIPCNPDRQEMRLWKLNK